MKNFHIIWKDEEDDFYSKGHTFTANNEGEALQAFRKEHPNAIFLAMYNTDIHNHKND